jgi:Carbohydrate esterase, sialic acid-specific acetylesterase
MRRQHFNRVALLGVGFCLGVAFQKWISFGRIVALFEPDPVHQPLAQPPALADETSLCILALGQSNAANYGSVRGRGGAGVFALHADRFYAAVDPLPGASGSGGSVWTRLAPRLLSRPENQSVVIAAVAQGSSPVKSWQKDGDNSARIRSAIKSFHRNQLKIDLVVWHQGETEAWEPAADGEAYRRHLEAMIGSLRNEGVDAPVFICLATRDGHGVVNPAIRQAQAAVWNRGKQVFAGADTDSLGASFRADGVHFNEAGLERFAGLLDEAFQRRSDREATSHSP